MANSPPHPVRLPNLIYLPMIAPTVHEIVNELQLILVLPYIFGLLFNRVHIHLWHRYKQFIILRLRNYTLVEYGVDLCFYIITVRPCLLYHSHRHFLAYRCNQIRCLHHVLGLPFVNRRFVIILNFSIELLLDVLLVEC